MPTAASLLGSLAHSDDTAYVVDRAYKLVQVNDAFLRFARENGGSALLEHWREASAVPAEPEELRKFFVGAFEQAWESGRRWEIDYECCSSALFRSFHMIAYPIAKQHMVLVHSLRIEEPLRREAHAPDDDAYVRAGFIRMCSHCRRVEHAQGNRRWDWVPAYLNQTVIPVSHGLCPPCSAYYWPG